MEARVGILASTVVRQRVTEIATQLACTGALYDPARTKLLETRKAVLNAWLNIADSLDIQGEPILAGDVRHFVRHLPRVLTDREHVAAALVAHFQQRRTREKTPEYTPDKTSEITG